MSKTYAGNKHEERAVAARAVLPFFRDIVGLILSFLPSCECETTLTLPLSQNIAWYDNRVLLQHGCLQHHKTFELCPRRWHKLFASCDLRRTYARAIHGLERRRLIYEMERIRLEKFAEAVMERGWDMDECPVCVMCMRCLTSESTTSAPGGLQIEDFGCVGPACTCCTNYLANEGVVL